MKFRFHSNADAVQRCLFLDTRKNFYKQLNDSTIEIMKQARVIF